MTNLLIIIIFLIAGFVCNRYLTLPASTPLRLNQLVIYFSLPAVVLLQIPRLDTDGSIWYPMLSCWLMIACCAALVLLLSKLLHWSREITGALLMVVPLGNTSYLGFPAVNLLLGESYLPYAILFDQLGNFIALAIYGSLVITWYSGADTGISVTKVAFQIIKFPPFIALLIALNLTSPVLTIEPLLKALAATLVPLAMFIVGLQFRLKLQPQYHKPLLLGLAVKMVFAPLLLIAAGTAGLANEKMIITTVLEAGMPPMVTAGVMAMAAGLAPGLCAGMVGTGLLLSFISLPLLTLLANGVFAGG